MTLKHALHPQAAQIILNRKQNPPQALTVQAQREEWLALIRALAAQGFGKRPVARVEDKSVTAREGYPIPVRFYLNQPMNERLPVVVFFHGGGWCKGNLETHDSTARTLATLVPCAVVAVDYRLAPEHKFPTGLHDCYDVVEWLSQHGAEWGIDTTRIAVVGDSAGGNLAAAVCLMRRDEGKPPLAYQVLVYPTSDISRFDTPSHLAFAEEDYVVNRSEIIAHAAYYVRDEADRWNPYISLVLADTHNLPPAFVITAEFDVLRDEGETYAQKLRAAGVPVTLTHYPGMIHGFWSLGAFLDSGKTAMEDTARRLCAALNLTYKE